MTAGAASPSKPKTGNPNTGKTKTGARCPICRAPTVKAHRPFCSKRCADVDLGRWLKGAYAVPGEPAHGEPSPGEPVSGEPL